MIASTNLNKNKMTGCFVGLPFFLVPESNFSESYEHFIVLNGKGLNPKQFWTDPWDAGLEIKKILRSPFGDQLEKYSRQMQIFSRQFVSCKWPSSGLVVFRAVAKPWNSQKHAKYREIQ